MGNRTTSGLPTQSPFSGQPLGSGKRITALTDGPEIAVDCGSTDIGTVTIAGNRTLLDPTGVPRPYQLLMIEVTQDATGGWTLSFGPAYRFGDDIPAIVLSTAPSVTDYIGFQYHPGDDRWDCIAFARGF